MITTATTTAAIPVASIASDNYYMGKALQGGLLIEKKKKDSRGISGMFVGLSILRVGRDTLESTGSVVAAVAAAVVAAVVRCFAVVAVAVGMLPLSL